MTEVRLNEPTLENQNKVRKALKEALEMQRQAYFKGFVNHYAANIDVISYAAENISGTKRVLYSLPEFTGTNYSAMYHLAHAYPLTKKVQQFLQKELAFLSSAE